MKPIKTIPLFLLLAAACTHSDPELPDGGNAPGTDPVEIRPTLSIAGMDEAVSTRAGAGMDEAVSTRTRAGMDQSLSTRAVTDGTAEMKFTFCSYEGTTASIPYTATRTGGTGAQPLTFSPVQYYPTNGGNVVCKGYYPQIAINPNTNTYIWDLDGTIDLIGGTATGSKTAPITNIPFSHLLAQLQFYPYAETQAIANQWGQIVQIEVLNQPSDVVWNHLSSTASAAIDLSTNKAFEVSGIPTPITIKPCDPAEIATKVTQVGNPCMIWPPTPDQNGGYYLSLRITTQLTATIQTQTTATKYYYPPAANTPYRIYLRFTGRNIEIDPQPCSINDWQQVTVSATSNKTYPYVEGGNTIVNSDAKGQGEYAIHANWTATPGHNDWSPEANQVSAKFEVADKDATGRVNLTDDVLNNTCQPPWRMPTKSEWLVIYRMRDELYMSFSGWWYWSATLFHNTPTNNGVAINWTGGVHSNTQPGGTISCSRGNNTFHVRCIKDL